MQPAHATSDMRWAEARVGPQRIRGAYAWRRFLALGVPVAAGSDFPVEEPNPLWGFYAAITRQDREGSPPAGWFPDHRMTREEALRSWTLTSAYAAFEEKSKGSIEPGKLADFIMLSDDIMTAPPSAILSARVKLTVSAGRSYFRNEPSTYGRAALSAASRLVLDDKIEIPRSEWRYVDIEAKERMAVVNCEFQVVSENSPVRVSGSRAAIWKTSAQAIARMYWRPRRSEWRASFGTSPPSRATTLWCWRTSPPAGCLPRCGCGCGWNRRLARERFRRSAAWP